jgi:hypothetical protein
MLPKGHFKDKIPAIEKWFKLNSQSGCHLADDYLQKFESTRVPLEISNEDTGSFERIESTLGYFLGCVKSRILRQLR